MHVKKFIKRARMNLEIYPIDNSRKGGAKPRNMEVSRESRSVNENNGSAMDKPTQIQQ